MLSGGGALAKEPPGVVGRWSGSSGLCSLRRAVADEERSSLAWLGLGLGLERSSLACEA